jgi:hypothetical protein
VTTDAWDVHQGGAVTSSSPTIANFNAVAIIGGANGGGEGGNGGVGDDAIFQDGQNFPVFVDFTRTNTTSLAGAILYNSSDNGAQGGNRQTTDFALFASSLNNGIYDVTLIPETPVTVEDGSGTMFSFTAPTVLTSFQAEFWGGSGSGPRIIELDAVAAVPEPSSLVAFCGLGAIGLFAAVRRYRKAQSAKA